MRYCAVCGKRITFRFDLCKKCEEFKDEEWVKALLKIERHNKYIEASSKAYSFISYEEYVDGKECLEHDLRDI